MVLAAATLRSLVLAGGPGKDHFHREPCEVPTNPRITMPGEGGAAACRR